VRVTLEIPTPAGQEVSWRAQIELGASATLKSSVGTVEAWGPGAVGPDLGADRLAIEAGANVLGTFGDWLAA